MAFDQTTRNRLQSFVSKARAILSEEFTRQLQATYGLDPKQGTIADIDSLSHLDNYQLQTAHILRDTVQHYMTTTVGKTQKEQVKLVLERIVREQAFTVLNRLAALRMAEARGFLLESIGSGYSSQGFQLYQMLEDGSHGETGDAYQSYLFSLFDEFGLDLAVLFDRFSVQGRLFPRETALLQLLEQINDYEIEPLWAEDETIGWIYQYFNSQEERKKMRSESSAPRNSRELAVRNQFFTPRYVVEFLTDNTLGRIWYEMTKGNTALVDSCQYLVRRPNEVFLIKDEISPIQNESNLDDESDALTQEDILSQPIYIPHRPLKDPRTIRMLDPACGSMHFGLYAFDLFEHIYLESWQIEVEQGADVFEREADLASLQSTFGDIESFKQQIPKLIIEHNIHGVDIDPRAVQIAGLSLWQRAQRAWHEQGMKPNQRPTIVKSNIVCAEPMPGEQDLLKEFTSTLNPPALGQLVEVIFEKMALAGEAGTLLKIEQEIQSAINEARNQWQDKKGSNRIGDLFEEELLATIPQQELGFDLSGIDDETFWEDAEQLILQALKNYSEQATSAAGEKRLFAEDAAKGFAFIDLSRKRFDVLLQNPPFGEATRRSKQYVKDSYPFSSRDILQAFVERLLELSNEMGVVGTLSARTGFFMGDSKYWREHVIFEQKLRIFVDLGLGVLDDALVEVASYIIQKSKDLNTPSLVTRHLATKDKEHSLYRDVKSYNDTGIGFIEFDQKLVKLVPDYVFAYWAPQSIIRRYTKLTSFREAVGANRVGIQTGNDFRFVRLAWEVDDKFIGRSKRWVRFSKGGEYSPGVDDIHLLLDWKGNGNQIATTKSARFQNSDYMFIRGVSYTVRTASAFSPRILPKDTVFSNMSQTWQTIDEKSLLASLAYVLCRVPQSYIELGVGGGDIATSGSAARRYTTAVVEGLPVIDLAQLQTDEWYKIINKLLVLKMTDLIFNENSADFKYLTTLNEGVDLENITRNIKSETLRSKKEALQLSYKIDCHITEGFQLDSSEESFVNEEVGVHPFSYNREPDQDILDTLSRLSDEELIYYAVEKSGAKRYFTKKSYFVDRRIEIIAHILEAEPNLVIDSMISNIQNYELKKTAKNILSELMGLVFGRWDIQTSHQLPRDPLAALPNIQPAKPKSLDRSVEKELSVFNLDESSDKDLLHGLYSIAHRIKGDKADSLIAECIDSSGAKDIREYFRNPNMFFSDHLSRYSRSRRQAPIYWPLQTQSGSYTLWVYYHRLNSQTLYSCVNDFVEPKLALVTEDLNTLSNNSNRSSTEEKELTKLTDLQNELKDFREELLRLARIWKPNLNDGVQITAAPLWKLFQHTAWQKKLKETWGKLEEGEYDWAHLAASMWPDRVLRKCHQDRSLAIAHDVEDMFWQEVEVPIMRGKKPTGKTKLEWQPIPASETMLNDMVNEAKARLQ